MIILDDGSTDGTRDIARQWEEKDSRIHFYRQENQGIVTQTGTNNKGLSISRGRYISIMKGDDLWEPQKLHRQYIVMEEDPEVVVTWGRTRAFLAETLKIQNISPAEDITIPLTWRNRPTGIILNALYLENMIPAVTITIRKTALEAIGGFKQVPDFPTTDLPTLADLALQGAFFFDDHVLGQWRLYSNQATKTYPVKIVHQRRKFVLDHIASLDPAVKRNVTLTTGKINRHFKNQLMIAYTTSGRYRLIRGEFTDARKDYLKAIFYPLIGNPGWRLRAIIGYLYSLFHWNVKGFSRKLDKVSYK
jgi:glycosyltransferase involved in cell wall biosynthesis